ncbi:GSU2403 family nucleotidyltransferase fold protein [Pelagerythrobacter marensis]|uniref:GSU2403 family nucleotidyltransferase fold protein n=1 Tax=Pelagerythrobacter marensis TaxID=543877 RepID=A0ABZ2D7G5_9SPHN
MALTDYTDEQARALVNLRQRYDAWRDAERAFRALPYDLRRKRVGPYAYLYEIRDRSGNGTSLGRWDEEAERRLTGFKAEKAAAKDRLAKARARLEEGGRLVRALRVPMLAAAPGPILREADCRGLLDGDLLVVGTNCLVAYQQEAVARFDVADETEDFDLAWAGEERPDGAPVWDLLKAVDPTFSVNTERGFQARNADAYEVELLVAPSRAAALARRDRPRPIPLPEQEWLLLGTPVDQVVVCRDGSAARIVAPDPRWFALHKLWLADQAKRDPLKRRKDRAQGRAVLDAVAQAMPHYPLDAAFARSVPGELASYWRDWREGAER